MRASEMDLLTGEELVYRTRHHWVILLKPLVLLLLSASFWGFGLYSFSFDLLPAGLPPGQLIAGVLLLSTPFFIYFLTRYLTYACTQFVLTNKRLVWMRRILSTTSVEILLTHVESLALDQGLVARLLNYGNLGVVGSGGSHNLLVRVRAPRELKRKAQEQVLALRR